MSVEEDIDTILSKYAEEFSDKNFWDQPVPIPVPPPPKEVAIMPPVATKRKSRFSELPNLTKHTQIDFLDPSLVDNERAGFGFSSEKKSSPPKNNEFLDQMKQAADRAKKIATQINVNSKPCSSSAYDSMTPERQKQFVEQKELQEIYDIMIVKRNQFQEEIAKHQLKSAKREYDSDEEEEARTSGGTWEHKLRKVEMEATRDWAVKLTDMADAKHHIGDFLPPNELKKFMETYQSLKEGRIPDHSDYKDFKLNAENLGFKLLQKFGWQEGQGLGKSNQGIVEPVNKYVYTKIKIIIKLSFWSNLCCP